MDFNSLIFWEVLVEKYPQNDRNYLPVQYIFLHGHPDCWGRVRPLGKKSFQIVFTKLTMIISIVLESESSDRVKHGFCIYIWFQIFYDIMHWQIETQGISKKVFFRTLWSNPESKSSDRVQHLAWIFEYLESNLESESSDQLQHVAWIFENLTNNQKVKVLTKFSMKQEYLNI